MTMIDNETLHLLEHQGRRMNHVLHEMTPPDRKEAELIQLRVDAILDRRPKPIAVNSDGEVLFEGTSPWVTTQAKPAVNATSEPERVITPEPVLPIGDDLVEGDGGVAVLEREHPRDDQPGDGRPRPPLSQAEVDRFGQELGGEA